MRKKRVLGLLTLSILFVQMIGGSYQLGGKQLIAQAAVCSTEDECTVKINEAKKEIAKLEEQEANLQVEISEIESDIATTHGQITEVEEGITVIKKNIASVQGAINQKESEIREKKSEINEKELEISENEATLNALDIEIEDLKELVAQRMRLSQRINNSNSILEVLSESESITDLIRRIRVINHLTQGDSEVMDELKDLIAQQQEIIQTLIQQQSELEAQRSELEAQQSELETQQNELSVQQASLEQQALVLETYQEKLKKQQEKLDKQLQEVQSAMMSAEDVIDIAREQQELLSKAPLVETKQSNTSSNADSSNANSTDDGGNSNNTGTDESQSSGNSDVNTPPSSTGFIVPLESGYVSCEFMCYTNHTGIDLANYGNTSTRVLASAAGVVVRAGWHSSYGNHVIISHNINGQTYTTLYAHMADTPQVSAGQTVSQGQVLGRMGSTGNSTGPHLHFEIYVGVYNYPHAVNPRNYVSFPTSW